VRLDPLVVNILMDLKLAVYELYVLQDGISWVMVLWKQHITGGMI
jgi:hypothetical protein